MNYYLNKVIKKLLTVFPKIFYPLYMRRNRFYQKKFCLKRGILCLSFDNDYRSDNEATKELLPMLKMHDIKTTWAVIGLWVKKYSSLHEELLKEGHELMNHTWSHPDNIELRPGDSRKFNQISSNEVDDEISRIHELCLKEFDYRIRGFRMPHFRTHPAVSGVLKRLDYKYTSNFNALYSPTLGIPYITSEGWAELPLSGMPRRPERIFETYRIFRNPDGLYESEEQYFTDFYSLLDWIEKFKLIGIMYMDACDVIRLSLPCFSNYLKEIRRRDIDVLTLGELADKVHDSKDKA